MVGAGVYLGVADAAKDPIALGEGDGGDAWGFYPRTGRIVGVDNSMAGHWGTTRYTNFNIATLLDTSDEIDGTVVTFTVDMDHHCFFVSVNGGPPVDAGRIIIIMQYHSMAQQVTVSCNTSCHAML